MTSQEIDQYLRQSIADSKLTSSERSAFSAWLDGEKPTSQEVGVLRSRAFAVARETLNDPQAPQVLDWLEAILKVIQQHDAAPAVATAAPGAVKSEAFFSPGDACVVQIVNLFGAAKKSADVCVFTITDDRISRAMLAAHQRGVKLRIITDNEKMHDPGSDIERFEQAGVQIKIDSTSYHMHHKFAIFDATRLLTGSYNWTRGAAESNQENFIVTNDPTLLREFNGEFESLWKKLENL